MTMSFYANVHDAPYVLGTTRLKTAGPMTFQRLHLFFKNHRLPNYCFWDLVVIWFPVICKGMKSLVYPYTLKINGEVPDIVGDNFTSRYSASDYRQMSLKPNHTSQDAIRPARPGGLCSFRMYLYETIIDPPHRKNETNPISTSSAALAHALHQTHSDGRFFAFRSGPKVYLFSLPSWFCSMERSPNRSRHIRPPRLSHIPQHAPSARPE